MFSLLTKLFQLLLEKCIKDIKSIKWTYNILFVLIYVGSWNMGLFKKDLYSKITALKAIADILKGLSHQIFLTFLLLLWFWWLFERFEVFNTKTSQRFLESPRWIFKGGQQCSKISYFLLGEPQQGVNSSQR